MSLQRIGKRPATGDCDCIPPTNTEVVVSSTVWAQSLGLDPSAKITPVSVPEGVEAELVDGELKVSHIGVCTTAVYLISSGCGSAVLTVRIPEAACVSPCLTAPTIKTDNRGQTTTTIPLGSTATLGAVTGIPASAVSIVDKELIIVGELEAGAYTIELLSACGRCVLEGEIERAPTIVCNPLRFVRQEGDTNLTVGESAQYCYIYSGSGPAELVGYEGLPLGLSATVTSTGEEHKVCITGELTVDKCTPEDGCRTGKLFLKNCAGSIEVVSKVHVTVPQEPAPLPVFCVGLVRLIDGTQLSGGTYQASFFPPGSPLYVDQVVEDCPHTELTTTTYTIGDDGTVVFPIPTPGLDLTIATCPRKKYTYRVRHDVCGVVSNMMTTPYCQITNDGCAQP